MIVDRNGKGLQESVRGLKGVRKTTRSLSVTSYPADRFRLTSLFGSSLHCFFFFGGGRVFAFCLGTEATYC
jgi:hypothetical protein